MSGARTDRDVPFTRTTCACTTCVSWCHRQPGPLVPGDFEKIAEFLGETREQATAHFWASPGSVAGNRATGQLIRVGTITPRYDAGRQRCVFLNDQDRCTIHPVAPFGCAYFGHTGDDEEQRGLWMLRQQLDPAYQALRAELPFATHYKPTGY